MEEKILDLYKIFIINNIQSYSNNENNNWNYKIINNNYLNPINYYLIIESDQNEAFAHWVFESGIYLLLLIELKKKYPLIKLHLKTKKIFKLLFIKKFNFSEDDICYDIKLPNTCIFIDPISRLCDNNISDEYKKQVDLFYNYFRSLSILNNKVGKSINILFLPRQKKENFKPNDRTYNTILLEKCPFITVLHTDQITNLNEQINYINSAKNIILTDGSPFLVNGMFAYNSTIFIIGNTTVGQIDFYKKMQYLEKKIIENNNKIIRIPIQKSYSFEDIEVFMD